MSFSLWKAVICFLAVSGYRCMVPDGQRNGGITDVIEDVLA